jgi:YjbE family integral membrane protein
MAVEQTAGPATAWMGSLFGDYGTTIVQLVEIMGINILLSGDNAVVIALACRSLPPKKRMLGIALGVLAAIVLRVIFTLGLQYVIAWPWLKLVGGVLLLIIAIQLLMEADDDDKVIADSKTLMGAMWTIALADVVMSLDNVLAIAGAAQGKPWLIFIGLAMSIPLIVGGATLIITLLTRFPILVWAGAALLGWIAGELIYEETRLADVYLVIEKSLSLAHANMHYAFSIAGALLVILLGFLTQLRGRKRSPAV